MNTMSHDVDAKTIATYPCGGKVEQWTHMQYGSLKEMDDCHRPMLAFGPTTSEILQLGIACKSHCFF